MRIEEEKETKVEGEEEKGNEGRRRTGKRKQR